MQPRCSVVSVVSLSLLCSLPQEVAQQDRKRFLLTVAFRMLKKSKQRKAQNPFMQRSATARLKLQTATGFHVHLNSFDHK